MGNAPSSLSLKLFEPIASTFEEARANPSAVLDKLNYHARTLSSFLLDIIKSAREDPSAMLQSLHEHGQNAVASLSLTAKEIQSSDRLANILTALKKTLSETTMRLCPYFRKAGAIVAAWWIPFTITIAVLYLFGGFGRSGVRGNSLASRYQSRHYGGYTPRGGFFADSTSASMRGKTPLIYKAAAVGVASVIAVVIYRGMISK